MLVSLLHDLCVANPHLPRPGKPAHAVACISHRSLILLHHLWHKSLSASLPCLMLVVYPWAESGVDKGLKAELNYVREECEAAQAKGKELQIKKNAAEARLVIPGHSVRAPTP